MKSFLQVFEIAGYNFRLWRKNPRIIVTFLLTFIMCYLLSRKTLAFAISHNTTMQIVEVFIWIFGDSGSILLSSSLLILLFADMPFISSGTPLYLFRTTRRIWVTAQMVYTFIATFLFLLFILICSSFFSVHQSFLENMWSPTAAIIGYTNADSRLAIPALIKTLEMSLPYQSMICIFGLMLGYSLTLVTIMLVCNLFGGQAAGVAGALAFSVYGFLLNPNTIQTLLKIPDDAYYIANVLVGWLSPLNHATLYMHNFGYDRLPRLYQSYTFFGILVLLLYFLAIKAVKRYNFYFVGTEE